jgi:tryptophan-rich sensory protein
MAEAVRRSEWWKLAIVAVIAIELVGGLSGWLSNSGYGNQWFDDLAKPSFMPPGYLFGIVWPILYALLGISVAMILAEPESDRRRVALALFWVQLVMNFAWSPIFFAAHQITIAKYWIWIMVLLAGAAAGQFYRLRKAAGLLMIPYIAWLIFASVLNATIEGMNPGASSPLFG